MIKRTWRRSLLPRQDIAQLESRAAFRQPQESSRLHEIDFDLLCQEIDQFSRQFENVPPAGRSVKIH